MVAQILANKFIITQLIQESVKSWKFPLERNREFDPFYGQRLTGYNRAANTEWCNGFRLEAAKNAQEMFRQVGCYQPKAP